MPTLHTAPRTPVAALTLLALCTSCSPGLLLVPADDVAAPDIDGPAPDAPAPDAPAPDAPPPDVTVPDVSPPCPAGLANCAGTCRPTGIACSSGLGACLRTGVTLCADRAITCSASPGAPSCEQCNGVDDDCDGVVDEDCVLWHLPFGARSWNVHPLDVIAACDPTRRSAHAPTEPIRAAFDVEALGIVYVLTATRWHVLDGDPARWTHAQWLASGPLADAFMPDAATRAYWASGVLYAYSVPADHGGGDDMNEGVEIITRDGAVFYTFNLATRRFVLGKSPVPAASIHWDPPCAPAYADVRSAWIDTHNRNDWIRASPATTCSHPDIPASDVTVHEIALTATTAHAMDAGSSFRFFSAMPLRDFPPFRYPNAPPVARIGDGAYLADGLWIFRAP